MQSEKQKNLREILGGSGESGKRTTIVLEKEEREFVDSLIREGKEAGIKPLISKILEVYRSLMIHDWRFPGEYYFGISRIALVNVELLDILIGEVPKEKRRQIGRKMGEASKVSMEATLGLKASESQNWREILKQLKIQGFGDFLVRDKYILVRAPFITEPEIWAGFLEGLLAAKVDVKTLTPPLVYEVKEKTSSA